MNTESAKTEIRNLIEGWARSVHELDIDGAVANHSRDMVMFDVPPPVEVRGIEAYRQTWPQFFESLKKDGTFEIDSLDITAGKDVAFATAVLRCGSAKEMKENREPRLRLTVGLRKESGHWIIAHEHHSFPIED